MCIAGDEKVGVLDLFAGRVADVGLGEVVHLVQGVDDLALAIEELKGREELLVDGPIFLSIDVGETKLVDRLGMLDSCQLAAVRFREGRCLAQVNARVGHHVAVGDDHRWNVRVVEVNHAVLNRYLLRDVATQELAKTRMNHQHGITREQLAWRHGRRGRSAFTDVANVASTILEESTLSVGEVAGERAWRAEKVANSSPDGTRGCGESASDGFE